MGWFFKKTTNNTGSEAEASCFNLRKLLNAKKWKIDNLASRARYFYLIGTFKTRKIRCSFKKTILGTMIELSSKPNVVPKKNFLV